MFGTWNHVVSQRDQALCHRASHVDRAMTAVEDDLLLSAGLFGGDLHRVGNECFTIGLARTKTPLIYSPS
jgi:hypothetical protein